MSRLDELSERVKRFRSAGFSSPPSSSELEEASNELQGLLLGKFPDDIAILDLLATVEELLCNPDKALQYLEIALKNGMARDRVQLKRKAKLLDSADFWKSCPLTPPQIRELGEYLESMGADHEPNGRTTSYTRRWLRKRSLDEDSILNAFSLMCGTTDFTILMNVVR